MTRADGTAADRRRGSVRVRGGSLQVRVFAGVDPVSGRDRYLSESVKGTDRAARRQADKVMARLQAEVDPAHARRRLDLEVVHPDAGDVLRPAAALPVALQRPPVRRAPSRRRA
jgi:hypothetical protein